MVWEINRTTAFRNRTNIFKTGNMIKSVKRTVKVYLVLVVANPSRHKIGGLIGAVSALLVKVTNMENRHTITLML